MDSWSFGDNVKAEKANAMRRYNRLRTIARLFRLAELCLAAVLLSWTFSRLPFVLRISLDYLRLFSHIASSTLFVFLLCNAIIVSLLANSRHLAASAAPPTIDVATHLSDQFPDGKASSDEAEEVEYQDKEIISEVTSTTADDPKPAEAKLDSGLDSESDSGLEFKKEIRRTKSEKFERDVAPAKQLKRSDTEDCRRMLRSGEEKMPEDSDQDDGLSDEEFQRTVEAFIERHKRFLHQEETMAIVLPNQSG